MGGDVAQGGTTALSCDRDYGRKCCPRLVREPPCHTRYGVEKEEGQKVEEEWNLLISIVLKKDKIFIDGSAVSTTTTNGPSLYEPHTCIAPWGNRGTQSSNKVKPVVVATQWNNQLQSSVYGLEHLDTDNSSLHGTWPPPPVECRRPSHVNDHLNYVSISIISPETLRAVLACVDRHASVSLFHYYQSLLPSHQSLVLYTDPAFNRHDPMASVVSLENTSTSTMPVSRQSNAQDGSMTHNGLSAQTDANMVGKEMDPHDYDSVPYYSVMSASPRDPNIGSSESSANSYRSQLAIEFSRLGPPMSSASRSLQLPQQIAKIQAERNGNSTKTRDMDEGLSVPSAASSDKSAFRKAQISVLYNFPPGSQKFETVQIGDEVATSSQEDSPMRVATNTTKQQQFPPSTRREYRSILLQNQAQVNEPRSPTSYADPMGPPAHETIKRQQERLEQRRQFLQEQQPISPNEKRLSGAEIDSHLEQVKQSLLEAKPKMSMKGIKALEKQNRPKTSSVRVGATSTEKNNRFTKPFSTSSYRQNKRSDSSQTYSPYTFFSGKNSCTSLVETDIDSGQSGDKPLVKETDLDSIFTASNPMRMMTKSLGNLNVPRDLDNEVFMSRTKSQNSLAQREALQKRLEEKAGSEYELQVARSLSRLNLPEWVGKNPSRPLSPSPRESLNSFTFSSSSYTPYEKTTLPPNFLSNYVKEIEKSTTQTLKLHPRNTELPQPQQNKNSPSHRSTGRSFERPSERVRSKSANTLVLKPIQSKIREALREAQQHQVDQENDSNRIEKESTHLVNSPPTKPIKLSSTSKEMSSRTMEVVSPVSCSSVETSESNETGNETKTFTFSNSSLIKSEPPEMQILLRLLKNKESCKELSINDKEELFRLFGQTTGNQVTTANHKFSPDLRRDLFLRGHRIPLREYFIEPTTSTLGRNENNERTLVCGYPYCRKEAPLERAMNTYCSCYNCFTYYCGAPCRSNDWKDHGGMCTFGRLKYWSNRMVKSLNPVQMKELVKLANQGYDIAGRGSVVMAFHSQTQAHDFVHGGTNVLVTAPSYFTMQELTTLDKTLQWPCENYALDKSFILTICIGAPSNNDHDPTKLYKQCTVLPKVAPDEPNVKTVCALGPLSVSQEPPSPGISQALPQKWRNESVITSPSISSGQASRKSFIQTEI